MYEGENQRPSPYLRGDEVYSYAQWKEKYGVLLHPALGGLLTQQEWNAAKDSTLNAFYTSSDVVQAMWSMVEKLGFRGGRVLNELIQTMNREIEEEPVTRLREELNSRYDTYTRQYGTVTPSRQNSYLMEDLEYPNIAALETLTPVNVEKHFTDGADLITLVQDAPNLKRTRVSVDIEAGDTTRRKEDKEKSLAAQEKQRELQEAFRSFVKNNDQVAVQIEDMYNERFNGHVARTFDVPDIRQYPGASSDVELRPNQKIAVTRALQESTLLAHGVGTGKTFEQITLAMEMRRLGTARKPWIVVQGSTLSQFAASFKRLYPSVGISGRTC